VRDHEPALALAGGDDGLDCYRLLAGQAASRLQPGGWLLAEVGIGQAAAVREIFAAAELQEAFCRSDLNGIPRVVGARCAALAAG
jgi:release factor glutamine methyltransferase